MVCVTSELLYTSCQSLTHLSTKRLKDQPTNINTSSEWSKQQSTAIHYTLNSIG